MYVNVALSIIADFDSLSWTSIHLGTMGMTLLFRLMTMGMTLLFKQVNSDEVLFPLWCDFSLGIWYRSVSNATTSEHAI